MVDTYAGLSKKGYAPYNPRKRNQDAIIMTEDPATSTVLFAVFDGHGEAGDLVSHHFSDKMPERLFAHAQWKSEPDAAICDVIKQLERIVNDGM